MATVLAVLPCLALSSDGAENHNDPADTLDFSRMTMTFDEPFDTIAVNAWGPIGGPSVGSSDAARWIAHTPWAGDFGAAAFTDPTVDFPFSVDEGILRITAGRRGTSSQPEPRWRSGLLSSVDRDGNGFAQRFGYFEVRARLPLGPGVWPAFWLIGKDRSKSTAEIDVLEFYGDRPDAYSAVVHVWHRDKRHDNAAQRIAFPAGQLPQDWHTYGVRVGPRWLRFYFDRTLVWKTPTMPEHRQPMYMLVNLALVNGPSHERAPDPSVMAVDYVRAFSMDGE